MRTDLIFIKDKAAEIIDDINSLDNIKKIGISQFIETSYNIQKNAEKLCLSARLLPLKSGFSKAKQEIEKTMIKETGICVGLLNQKWIKITLPALLPKKETGGVEYIRDSLNVALNEYMKKHERELMKEPVIMIFHHIYSSTHKGRRYRDHDNIEINAVADVVTLNFLTDDNPNYCQHFQYTTLGETDHTEIYLIPTTDFPEWVSEFYEYDMEKQEGK